MKTSSIFFTVLSIAFFLALAAVALADTGNPLTASFTSNVTGGEVPLTVRFNDTSTGNITRWE